MAPLVIFWFGNLLPSYYCYMFNIICPTFLVVFRRVVSLLTTHSWTQNLICPSYARFRKVLYPLRHILALKKKSLFRLHMHFFLNKNTHNSTKQIKWVSSYTILILCFFLLLKSQANILNDAFFFCLHSQDFIISIFSHH